MAKTELVLKYVNNDFGKQLPDGTYRIRGDIKTYCLVVDGVEVINLTVEYERFQETQKDYSNAYISYDNKFFLEPNSPYTNKGYATLALDTITESLLREGLVPRITLNISDDNLRSKRVAEKVGYKHVKNDEYSVYNPNALKMYEQGLAYLKDSDYELYEMQLKFKIDDMKRYIDSAIEGYKKTK